MDKNSITNIEELSLNVWPSLQTLFYDGWVMRFAGGYTKRANSVNPVYSSSIDVGEKIRLCEWFYQEKNLPVVFKMTSSVYPADLDETLQAQGYRVDSPTSVHTVDLSALDLPVDAGVEIQPALSEAWLENFCRMSTVPASNRIILQQILTNIIPPRCFVSLQANDRIIACGLGVLQSGYIGLFDIVTDHDFRNRGYGRQLVTSILAWGRQNGAQTAYLQVMLRNLAALGLYSRIGFTEQYRYWYRIKP